MKVFKISDTNIYSWFFLFYLKTFRNNKSAYLLKTYFCKFYLNEIFIMNTRYCLIFILAFFLTPFAFSQNGSIKGIVKDADSKENIFYGNVSILQAENKKFVQGTITDEAGMFHFSNLKPGKYILAATFISYKRLEQDFTVSTDRKNIDLQTLYLEPDTKLLKEVEIVELGSQMRMDIDKKVFDVDRNIASSGGSASDVLTNIPSVQVDNEGEVSLRGNSSVTVWINGKASGLTADNRAQILAQLPAESIERIEVITNPSAKYDPEGTGGIINIVLKNNRKPGYYGSVQGGIDTELGYNLNGNINYSSGKIEAYAGVGRRVNRNTGGGYSDRTNTDAQGNPISFLNQDSENKSGGGPYTFRLGGTYHITEKDHLGITGSGMFGFREQNGTINYESNVPNSYISSLRTTSSESQMRNANAELNYKHDFTEKSNLNLSASYNLWNRDEESVYEQSYLYADSSTRTSYQRQINDVNTNTWEFKADYVNEFGKENKIEAGYQSTLNRRESPVETFSGANQSSAIFDDNLYNRFLYNQDIHALYATFSKRIQKFGVQVGARGEYTNIDMKTLGYNQTESDVTPYKKDYFSFFPSVFLSYQLPKNNEIQLNYTRRIRRPSGWQLNPFMNITDSANISYGNPYLDPEFSNSLEFNYLKNWRNHTISASVYYKNTDDVIQRISYLENNIMKTTFENVAQSQSAGMELVVKNGLFKFLDLTTTLNLYYSTLSAFSYLPDGATKPVTGDASEDFSWDVKVIANLLLPYAFSFQITGSYNAPQLVAQGYREANYGLDAGIRKSFFDKKLNLSLSARNILNSQKRETHTSGNGFIQDAATWRSRCVVNFTATYSFGNMKAKKTPQPKQQTNGNNGMEGEEF